MLKTAKFIFRIIQDSTNEIYDICNGKDLIIVTHSHMGAVEAEVLGIPTVNVTLQTEMIAEKLKKKTLKNKILGSIIATISEILPSLFTDTTSFVQMYGTPSISSSLKNSLSSIFPLLSESECI